MVLANAISNFIHNRFKLKVVMFAKENGNCVAGREFKVNKRCIRRWRGQEGVRKKHPTRKDRYDMAWQSPELEVELIGWSKAKRQQGIAVSTTLSCRKAKCWAKDHGINFKASLDWCQRFMN